MKAIGLVLALPLLLGATAQAPKPAKPSKPPKTSPPPPGVAEETRKLPGFGDVTVYRPSDLAKARGVVLFISGDGGWNLGVVDMARRLAPHAIVAGLSMPAWQRRAEQSPASCWYPAGDLEVAAQALEKAYTLPRYVRPVLVGYSSGATVVYGAMAQAPPTTFRGAVSLGFCPDLEVKRPFCGTKTWKPGWDEKKKQSWLPETDAIPAREGGGTKWIALQGLIDQVCAPDQTVAFVRRVPNAEVVSLEKVGHGFSVPSRWGGAFDRAVGGLLDAGSVLDPQPHLVHRDATYLSPDDLAAKLDTLDLPLETFWPASPQAVLIFVSGDGGWAELDDTVAHALASRGVAVIGWNALRYFWLAKRPETFATALGRLVDALPGNLPVYAGGYSFGAETVSVILAGDESPTLARIAGLVLLAPGAYAEFEISPLDWFRGDGSPTAHPVGKALEAAGRPILCLEPKGSSDSGCAIPPEATLERVVLPGGHHFDRDYEGLAARIASFISANNPR